MQINKVDSKLGFGSMFIGASIEKKLAAPNSSKRLNKKLENIKQIVKLNGFDEKENVDFILNINDKGSFYATISPKREDIPMHPQVNCAISSDQRTIDRFVYWLNAWNDNYDPEWLSIMDKILKKKS